MAVEFLMLGISSDRFPERGAVVQIVGNDRAILLSGFHRLFSDQRCCLGQCAKNPPGMEPSGSVSREDLPPVDVTGPELGNCGVSAVGTANGRANSEATFGKVQPVTYRAANPVIRNPANVF